MTGTTDFVPFATQAGALVEALASYTADPQTALGQQNGIADPANANRAWRQGTFQAAMIATFVANTLNINVPDDGNLSTAVTNFMNALAASIGASYINPRTRLSANQTYYVNASTGSDSNNGTSSGTAWLTLNHAWQFIQESIDLGGFVITVNCSGTFANGLSAAGALVGATLGASSVVFDFAAGSSVNVTNSNCFFVENGAALTIEGTASLSATGAGPLLGVGIYASNSGSIVVNTNNITFGSCSTTHMWSAQSSQITLLGNWTYNGDSPFHIQCSGASFFGANGVTGTASGTRTFSGSFINVFSCAVAQVGSDSFPGSVNGVRYLISLNGVIATGSGNPNYFPGTSAGSAVTGGQYT